MKPTPATVAYCACCRHVWRIEEIVSTYLGAFICRRCLGLPSAVVERFVCGGKA